VSDSAAAASSLADPGSRGRLALAVAGATDSVPGARRSAGSGIPVATQHPGGRVIGVALSNDRVTVHVVAQRMDVANIAGSVHEAVRQVLLRSDDQRTVSVVVDDLEIFGQI
jgi:hypothetical protein